MPENYRPNRAWPSPRELALARPLAQHPRREPKHSHPAHPARRGYLRAWPSPWLDGIRGGTCQRNPQRLLARRLGQGSQTRNRQRSKTPEQTKQRIDETVDTAKEVGRITQQKF